MKKELVQEDINFNVDEIKKQLLKNFPLGFIPREKITEATGGILISKTMANKDCDDEGIKGSIRIGKKVCYPINGVIDFIIENTSFVKAA